MLIRVLGAIEVLGGPQGSWMRLPGQQRMLVALLVANLGVPCRTDQLVQALWGEQAPPQAARLVQSQVSRLRRVLEANQARGSRLRALSQGWVLDIAPDSMDAGRLEQLVDRAADLAAEDQPSAARDRLEEAVALWRGSPFGDLADHELISAPAARFEEKYLAGWQHLLRLRLEAGEPDSVVADAGQLVTAYPLRERLWGLFMEAQCRAGQPANALATYQRVRERLADELGIDPSPELQRLHTAILRHQVAGSAGRSPKTGDAPVRRGRKTGQWPCRCGLSLVGRNQTLDVLRRALTRAQQGAPQVALVAGEPGIGKTRVVAELAEMAATEGVDVMAGRCTEGAGVPYQPFVEALSADVDATADDELAARLGRDSAELTRLLPSLAARTGWQRGPPSVSTELDQHRLLTAMTGWLAAASAQAPVVLIAEDVHAATRSTWLVLDHVVRTASSARLLVIATYRDTADYLPDDLADTVAELDRRPDVTHVSLAGLDRAAVAELLATERGLVSASSGWVAAVRAASGGNPLFIEELLATLPADSPVEPRELTDCVETPRGVAQLVTTRLRRLAPTTVWWLDHAAIAGACFDFTTATRASGLPEDQALDAVGEATAARLVIATGADDGYAFTHGVTRMALLTRLTPSRRLRLHARLTVALGAGQPDEATRAAHRLVHHRPGAHPVDGLITTPPLRTGRRG